MIVDILHSQRIIWIEIFSTCFKIFKSRSFTSLDVTYWILRIFHHPLHVYQDIILYKGSAQGGGDVFPKTGHACIQEVQLQFQT